MSVRQLDCLTDTGNLVVSEKKDTTGHTLLRVHQSYDAAGQLVGQSWYVGATYYSESYSYNTADGSLNTMVAGTGETLQFTYDDLQRLTSVNNSLYTRNYSYRNLSDTTTTTQVSQVQYNIGSANLTYGYTYDAMGNIATYTAPGKSTVTYTYDALGQLVSAVGDETYTYTYDSAGNLLTANGHTYTYGAPGWPDVLFKFDGQTITFDMNANPLSYYNGTRWNFTWENGRSLATATDGTTSISYAYDADGLRTAKTVGSVTHKYLYASGQLLRESYGNNILDFFYDANGYPYALKYNGTTYYYITNLQGDVMYLVDAQGSTVAAYDYDPYGNIISATGTMAEVNPLRYRGYYYDADLKMYYLQSRYYDPAIGRFLNADDTDILAFDQDSPLRYNLFSYCHNNPVNMTDVNGYIPFFAITGIIGAVAGGIVGYATTGSWKGALAGVAIGGAIGITGGAIAGKLLAGSAIANTSAVIAGGKTLLATTGTMTASSWQHAEQILRKKYHGVSKAISTPEGRRIVDSLSGKIARESKYGYQSASTFIKKEILKDLHLISKGYKVEWHFFWSQASNSGGPSGPLREELLKAGIKIVEHFKR